MKTVPLAVRLARRTNYDGPIQPHMSTPCHIWTGAVNNMGYGVIGVAGNRLMLVHRVAWILKHGSIPDEAPCVLHICDTPRCVNPGHLRIGTKADNSADMAAKGRSTKGDRNPTRLYPERRARGERSGSSKLTSAQVVKIRELYAQGGVSQHALGAMFGVCQESVRMIVRNESWTHI